MSNLEDLPSQVGRDVEQRHEAQHLQQRNRRPPVGTEENGDHLVGIEEQEVRSSDLKAEE